MITILLLLLIIIIIIIIIIVQLIIIIITSSCGAGPRSSFGRGEDAVGDPHRARIPRFELFELVLLSKVDKLCSLSSNSRQQHLGQTVPSRPRIGAGEGGFRPPLLYLFFHRPRRGGSEKGDPKNSSFELLRCDSNILVIIV